MNLFFYANAAFMNKDRPSYVFRVFVPARMMIGSRTWCPVKIREYMLCRIKVLP